jgi:hypothetical protein
MAHPIQEIIEEMIEMSGCILWRVTGTWAHNGRTGEFSDIVIARDALEAVKRVWEPEDPKDLRTIQAEWLCPVESVKKWNDYQDLDEET